MDYTIAAIPTIYNGRRYRSRLEARWAAFFDLCGWLHEYEPRDLGKWSPDFALWGIRPKLPVLVEVKPISDWDRETARKVMDNLPEDVSYGLLLGAAPITHGSPYTQIGWIGQRASQYEAAWGEAFGGVDAAGRIDIQPHDENGFISPETLFFETQQELSVFDLMPKWAEAANLVQWHPKRSRT